MQTVFAATVTLGGRCIVWQSRQLGTALNLRHFTTRLTYPQITTFCNGEHFALLLSMTGHGEARRHDASLAISVEVRSVNNRFLKVTLRASESDPSLESLVEAAVRKHLQRGSVQVNLRIERQATEDQFRLNEPVIRGYVDQLSKISQTLPALAAKIDLAAVLHLPGVVADRRGEAGSTIETIWPQIESVLQEALAALANMRAEEGRAMGQDLTENCRLIREELAQIETRAPLVVEGYRTRLTDRLNKLLAGLGLDSEPRDVVREVGLFAERCDISEEIVRLRCHLDQIAIVMQSDNTPGRKLDFLTQEMFRETNTIGSKASDAKIASHVVEIKSVIERIREMVQNIE